MKKKTERVEAYSYEDGDEIRVNIVDENSSVLLTFVSEKDFRDFCKDVANLEKMGVNRKE